MSTIITENSVLGSTHILLDIDFVLFHPFPDGHPVDTQLQKIIKYL